MPELTLTLPLPPSPNDWASHPMEQARQKNTYRKQAWAAALSQAMPKHDPPEKVAISARFYVRNLRDEDNLTGGLKWTLDALKQVQKGKMRWRQGIADEKGFFVDDDPEHMQLLKPTQEIDRSEPRVELVILWKAREEAA